MELGVACFFSGDSLMFGNNLKVKKAAKRLCKATGTKQLFSLAGARAPSTCV